jgi:hypothetical protein
MKKQKNKYSTCSKKSQSEILGFAMVMILVVVGLAIYVRFSLTQTEPDYVNVFTKNQLPLYLNNAILETNVPECYGEKISKLLIRCAEGKNFVCTQTPNLFGNATNVPTTACDASKLIITQALNITLNKNDFQYRYYVYTGNDYTKNNLFNVSNTRNFCSNMNIPHPGRLFFRTATNELLNAKLDICYDR